MLVSDPKEKQKIILIGGGFAGVQFVKNIDEPLFDVLLKDKINHCWCWTYWCRTSRRFCRNQKKYITQRLSRHQFFTIQYQLD